jgi:transcription elongation factor GreA
MLENAQIGTPPSDTGTIAIGHVVTVEFADGDSERFWLVSREEAVHSTMDVYSPDSPLGNAVIGKKQGDNSSFALPNGKEITIAIKKVEIYQA